MGSIEELKAIGGKVVRRLRKQKLEEREQDFFASMKAGLDITFRN